MWPRNRGPSRPRGVRRRAGAVTGAGETGLVSRTNARSLALFRSERRDECLEAIGTAGDPLARALQAQDLGGAFVLAVHGQHELCEARGPGLVEVLGGREHA